MKKFFGLFLKISISIALVVLMVKWMKLDLMETLRQIRATDLKWFIICTLFLVGTVFTNTFRWRILANLLDYDLSFLKALRMYFEAMFSNNFLPTNFGGDAVRAYDLGRPTKTWLRAASTVFMERLFGFTGLFSLVPIGLISLRFSKYHDSIPREIELALWATFFGMVCVYISYPLWSKIPLGIIQKIRSYINEYTKCKKSLGKVLIWTVATHIVFISGNISAAYALGATLEQIPLWYWFILVPGSSLIGFVVPGVKGVSPKEASYVYILGLIGVPADLSLAIAFLTFIATLLSTLPGLTIAFRKVKIFDAAEEESMHLDEEIKERAEMKKNAM